MEELRGRSQRLAEERDGLVSQLHATAGSLREAERALASQQAGLAQQQRRAEDAAQGSEKVPRTRMPGSASIHIDTRPSLHAAPGRGRTKSASGRREHSDYCELSQGHPEH